MLNQEKRWDWKHMLNYKMRIEQCEIAPKIELKKMPKKVKDLIEKDVQKGKILNWKRCLNGKRLCWERWNMVYLLLTFLFRQLN